jgi:glycosyltransferase involved in cell wall biosynthesis/SAM-dependent methyltransferase
MSIHDVAHVGPNLLPIPPPMGGAIERKMWSLARAQIGLGVNATIYAVGTGLPQQPPPHPRVVVVNRRDRGRFELETAWRIARQRPDAVHLHSRPEVAVALRAFGYRGLIALSFNFPLMLPAVIHKLAGGGYGRGVGRGLSSAIDVFLPESEYAGREFVARGGSLPRARTAVLWNGTDCPSDPPRRRSGRPQALFVGRFVRQKGADLLVSASERLPGWEFVAVGPRGEFHTGSGDTTGVAELGRVEHRGPQPDAVVAELMAAATCLVLPTREWEVFGMVLVEALARGTPVVASDAAGPPEILAQCPAAHFFCPGDVDSLVAAIEAAGLDGEDDRGSGQMFAQRFCWSAIAARSVELYERALSDRSSRRHRRLPSEGSTVARRIDAEARTTADQFIESMSYGYLQPSLLAWRAREAVLYRRHDDGLVIDLGAGYGHFIREIAHRDVAIAVDLDIVQLRGGLTAGSYRAAVCADMSALPFRACSTSSVISNCVLEHLEDLPGALAEVRRVLKAPGTLQTTVPIVGINKAYLFPSIRYHDLRNRQLAHRTLLTREGWQQLFERNGFIVARQLTAVSRGEGRRWDLLDAPLFLGFAGKTAFGAYVKLLNQLPAVKGAQRRLSKALARWILAGRRRADVSICLYLELQPSLLAEDNRARPIGVP